jgi:hypothetical protein
VEMRTGMVSLVPIHVDRDAVEEADARHRSTVRPRAAATAAAKR